MTIWGIAIMFLFFGAIGFWVLREQRKDRTVLRTSHHPELGEIRHYRSCWEANITIPACEHSVLIDGDDPETAPSEACLKSLHHIKANYSMILPQCIEATNAMTQGIEITVTEQTAQLVEISLYDKAVGDFILTFEFPSFKKKIPNGVSIFFRNYELTDLSDNH